MIFNRTIKKEKNRFYFPLMLHYVIVVIVVFCGY